MQEDILANQTQEEGGSVTPPEVIVPACARGGRVLFLRHALINPNPNPCLNILSNLGSCCRSRRRFGEISQMMWSGFGASRGDDMSFNSDDGVLKKETLV
jgi:hypothetical protein